LLAARLLPTKHRELMPQNQQLDLFREHVAAAAVHEQPQQGRNLVLKPLIVLGAAICSFAS
jgi:hypothetical protein